MAYLIFCDKADKETIPVAGKTEFHLGRTEENDLAILDDPLVSRKHCAIYRHSGGDKFILRDMSRNGTVVNGEILSGQEAFLSDGDMIKVGGAKFTFRMDAPEIYQTTSTLIMKYGTLKKEQVSSGSQPRFESSSALPPGTEINGYRIIRTLLTGENSTVYLVLQEAVKRTVALEIYAEPSDSEAKLFFKDFTPKIGRISHTNALLFLDCGIFNGFCYLVMPYMSEGNLEDRISRKTSLSEKKTIDIIRKIAGVLEYAMTEHCLLHLDLNPSNILFSDSDEPVLSRLGISQWEARNYQGKRMYFRGNPAYMSPEQALDLRADWRSDLYSLGIIFFEMLTGRVPFTAQDEKDMIKKHVEEKIVFPPNLTKDIVSILSAMTAKTPEDRFSSWGALIKALNFVVEPKKNSQSMNHKPFLKQPPRMAGNFLK